MRLAAAVVCAALGTALGIEAQILTDAATTRNGSELYFASVLGVKGSEVLPHPKIFKWTREEGFRIFAQRPNLGDQGTGLSNPFSLFHPQVTETGNMVAYTAARTCYRFVRGCAVPNPPETDIVVKDQQGSVSETVVDGEVRVSPTGRYALRYSLAAVFTWFDRETGEQRDLALPAGEVAPARHSLTRDGRAIFYLQNHVRLWSLSGDRVFDFPAPLINAAISADGRVIVASGYEQRAGATNRHFVLALDVESGRIVERQGGLAALSISDDGGLVLSNIPDPHDPVNRQQLLLSRTDGSVEWQISDLPEGVQYSVLSGDGRIVYSITTLSRILRYEVATGITEEISPRFPWVGTMGPTAVPGSLFRILGLGLSSVSATLEAPLPSEAGDVKVELDGVALPLYRIAPWSLDTQIPWKLTPGVRTVRISAPESAFAQAELKVSVVEFQPELPPGGTSEAIHADGVTPVSPTAPARAGEIVYLRVSGLGQVQPEIEDGVPAPGAPLLHPLKTISARLTHPGLGNTRDAEVVDAVLAPGSFGVYRLTIRLPTSRLTPDPGSNLLFTNLQVLPAGPYATFSVGLPYLVE